MLALSGFRDFDDTVRAFDFLHRRLEPLFDEGSRAPARDRVRRIARPAWPQVNAFETTEAFVFRAQVPGLGDGDVSVHLEDDALVIRGERKVDVPENYAVHLRERAAVAFGRKLPLPGRVDGEAVTAAMKDGVLTITLPKAKDALPRRIAVNGR